MEASSRDSGILSTVFAVLHNLHAISRLRNHALSAVSQRSRSESAFSDVCCMKMAAATDRQELAENLAQHQAQLEQVCYAKLIPRMFCLNSVLRGIIVGVGSV